MIYPVDSPIQCLNNWALGPFFFQYEPVSKQQAKKLHGLHPRA